MKAKTLSYNQTHGVQGVVTPQAGSPPDIALRNPVLIAIGISGRRGAFYYGGLRRAMPDKEEMMVWTTQTLFIF